MVFPGVWDENKLDTCFLSLDQKVIRSIPLSINPRQGKLIWHYEKEKVYSVKSGYHILQQDKIREVGSFSRIMPSR